MNLVRLLALNCLVAAGFGAERPNVLLIIVDDLNTALGCYGHPLVKSPNIDRLAQRGIRFDHAYSHYPMCHPSRTALLSGRRPATTRVFNNETSPRAHLKDMVFLPEHFRQQRYFTARVGKIAHGAFDHEFGWHTALEAVRTRPQYKGDWLSVTNEDEPDATIAPQVARLLEQHRGKPFLIAAGFDKPHIPMVAPQRFFDLYPLDSIKLPEQPADPRKDVPAIAFSSTRGWRNETEHRQVVAAYYACVSFVDAQVGIILDAVDRLGLAGDTIICFTSDHGFHLGEHGGLWRKSTLFEESARVPLIIATPQTRNAQVSSRVVEHVDLYPTLLDLCGLPRPDGLEGKSLTPLLNDPASAWDGAAATLLLRERLFGTVAGQSIRTERWRYTEWDLNRKGNELYDHSTDPREWLNLARDPRYAATVAELRRQLYQTMKPPVIEQSNLVRLAPLVVIPAIWLVFYFLKSRKRRSAS